MDTRYKFESIMLEYVSYMMVNYETVTGQINEAVRKYANRSSRKLYKIIERGLSIEANSNNLELGIVLRILLYRKYLFENDDFRSKSNETMMVFLREYNLIEYVIDWTFFSKNYDQIASFLNEYPHYQLLFKSGKD